MAGAFVEGAAKFREDLRLRRDDYTKILGEIHSDLTSDRRIRCLLYDLLYIRGRMPRGKDVLSTILKDLPESEKQKIIKLLKSENFFSYLLDDKVDSKYRGLLPLLEEERNETVLLLK